MNLKEKYSNPSLNRASSFAPSPHRRFFKLYINVNFAGIPLLLTVVVTKT